MSIIELKTPRGWMKGAERVATGDKLGDIAMPWEPPENINVWYINKARDLSFGHRKVRVDDRPTPVIIGSSTTMIPRCPTRAEIAYVMSAFGIPCYHILRESEDWVYVDWVEEGWIPTGSESSDSRQMATMVCWAGTTRLRQLGLRPVSATLRAGNVR